MSDFRDKFMRLFDTRDTTDDYDPDDIRENKLMAVFAYLPMLVLVPLFAAEKSEYARFHANQGLLLAIVELFCWIVFGILIKLPLVGWLFRVIQAVLGLVCLLFAVVGILRAVAGKTKELPLIGKFKLLR